MIENRSAFEEEYNSGGRHETRKMSQLAAKTTVQGSVGRRMEPTHFTMYELINLPFAAGVLQLMLY
jgi:hypothetical protein